MPKGSQFLRPNHSRSVEVFGEFNDGLASKLLSDVASLRSAGNEPITVYINSYGGGIRTLDIIEGILRCSDLDKARTIFITVAVGNAASAGANLLTFGHYAYAYEHSFIHFHGAQSRDLPDTFEDASQMANELQRLNRRISRSLAESVVGRLVFRYQSLKSEFKKPRKSKGNDNELVDLNCFLQVISKKISPSANRLINDIHRHVKSASDLSNKVLPTILATMKRDDTAVADSKVLHGVIKHELRENKRRNKKWRLDERGMNQIVTDYFLIRDYNLGEHWGLVNDLLEVFGSDFLTPSELKTFSKVRKNRDKAVLFLFKHAAGRLTPFWYFTVSLCRFLMRGENRLTPNDAYYLGIVDEVIGTDLTGRRVIVEQAMAEAKAKAEKEKKQKKDSTQAVPAKV